MLVNAIKEIGVNPKTKEEYAKYKTSIQKIINNLNNNKMWQKDVNNLNLYISLFNNKLLSKLENNENKKDISD